MKRKINYLSIEGARRKGKQDGRTRKLRFGFPIWEQLTPYPPVDQLEPAQFELESAGHCRSYIQSLCEDWSRDDRELRMEYCLAKNEEHQASVPIEKESREAAEAVKEYQEAKKAFDSFPMPHMSRSIALFLTLILIFPEFVINRTVFRILGDNQMLVNIFALGIGAIVLLMSHLAGSGLKKPVPKTVKMFLFFFLPFMLLAFVSFSYLREKGFESLNAEDILGIKVSPLLMTIVFLTLNMLIFGIGMWLAYESSHSDPDAFQQIKKRLRTATAANSKEGSEVIQAIKRFEAATERLIRAQAKRKSTFEDYQKQARTQIEAFRSYIHAYRGGNLDARKDRTTPLSFKQDPVLISMPPELTGPLDWSC